MLRSVDDGIVMATTTTKSRFTDVIRYRIAAMRECLDWYGLPFFAFEYLRA